MRGSHSSGDRLCQPSSTCGLNQCNYVTKFYNCETIGCIFLICCTIYCLLPSVTYSGCSLLWLPSHLLIYFSLAHSWLLICSYWPSHDTPGVTRQDADIQRHRYLPSPWAATFVSGAAQTPTRLLTSWLDKNQNQRTRSGDDGIALITVETNRMWVPIKLNYGMTIYNFKWVCNSITICIYSIPSD